MGLRNRPWRPLSRVERSVYVIDRAVIEGLSCRIVFAFHGLPDHRGEPASVRVYVGFWGPNVRRCWEPFDQPDRSSYIPHRYADLLRESVPNDGDVLVYADALRRGDGHDPGRPRLPRESVRSEIDRIFKKAGAADGVADVAMPMVWRASVLARTGLVAR